jgi:hypothetical protein
VSSIVATWQVGLSRHGGKVTCAHRLARRAEAFADQLAAQRLIEIGALADAIAWAPLNPSEVAEHLDVTEDVLRRRLHSLTPPEAQQIEQRLAAKEDAA